MQWGKAKTVLIAVLLAVNIFLFLVTQQSVRSRSRLDEEYIDNAISLLSTRGVFIREEDFSSSKLLLSTATISTKEMLYPFARALLEDQTLEPSVEGDGVWFRGEKGSVLLSGAADFSFEAEQPPKDLGEVGELLQMAGFSQEEFVEQDGRLVQTLFDVPMYGCEVSLKNGVVTGRLLVTAKAVQKHDELIDAANALLAFSAWLEEPSLAAHTVEQVTPIYLVETAGLFNTATCTPGYRVQTGEGACLINAVTGEVQSEES